MKQGHIINAKLRAWRIAQGFTMEQAGAAIVVDGKATDKATWFGWECKGKLPKPAFMFELERVTGLEPNDFYGRRPGDNDDEAGATAPALAACG